MIPVAGLRAASGGLDGTANRQVCQSKEPLIPFQFRRFVPVCWADGQVEKVVDFEQFG